MKNGDIMKNGDFSMKPPPVGCISAASGRVIKTFVASQATK
jgi:hypothetical protein